MIDKVFVSENLNLKEDSTREGIKVEGTCTLKKLEVQEEKGKGLEAPNCRKLY
jgi:hypothetical protein